MSDSGDPKLDFNNTEIAFSYKSNKELIRTYRLFQLMNNPTLVKLGSLFGNLAAKMPFGIGDPFIRETIFFQFCGGTNLFECQKVVDRLNFRNTLTILDFGVEAKEKEEDFEHTLAENIKAIEFACSNPNVPVISTKLTGYVSVNLLEKIQSGENLSELEKNQFQRLENRFAQLCKKAHEMGVSIFVDAEESWIQDPIDQLVLKYMAIYNKEKPILYNTYQLYRKDRLNYLKDNLKLAKENNFILGVKIVRGAYMEKERKRAEDKGYPDPIQPDKSSTDGDYNDALRFCIDNIDQISLCNSSHNWESNLLQVDLMTQNQISRDHPHMNFCQLYGMSDNITFNLSAQGYNVAKYVPYGPIREVTPYLTRRAQENTSVTGDMSRELNLLTKEMKRRGLL
ncbi:MAG: proline dehydrogenase family protein [Saprospiraceae bacterium]|nr:proline dehydrogenase family protein [Candidatus Vicinibacter affinis]